MLVPFPFTDLSGLKVRPAVVLRAEATAPDLVVAYLSSVVPDGPLPEASILISPDHPEFPATGLRRASVLRLDKLMTVARARVHRRLGRMGPSLLADLDSRLRIVFRL